MNKVISICGLIFCSSLGFSLKAKADPTWSNWATCPTGTWAIGFTISKASAISLDGTPAKINALKLECADLDRSLSSFISANPLDGRSGLNWQNTIFVGSGYLTGITARFTPAPYLSHFRESSAYITNQSGYNEIVLQDSRFPGVSDAGGWAQCGPGEALNGLVIQSDEIMFSAVAGSCSSYQGAIDARIAAADNLARGNRLEFLEQYIRDERILVENDVKSASIHKISFETLNSNITGASCAIDKLNKTVYITSTVAELDSFVDLFTKTFGHNDWRSNAISCNNYSQSVSEYTSCSDGSVDAICLTRRGYLDIKSRLEKKLADYTKYRDEANAIGDGAVCYYIEQLSQKILIDVADDLSSKIAAGALSGTCTTEFILRTPVAETFPILVPGGSGSGTATAGGVVTP